MKKVFIQAPLQKHICMPKEESHHVLHVLRYNGKEPLVVGDSFGCEGSYILSEEGTDGETYWTLVGSISEGDSEKKPIVLIQSYVKGEKLDWILQKSSELDCTAILVGPTEHSVVKLDAKKQEKKVVRWQKILKEAAQQSNRQRLVQLTTFSAFSDIDSYLKEKYPNIGRLVAYEGEETYSLKEYLSKEEPFTQQGVAIFIGPEGGFSRDEITVLEKDYVFQPVSLGNTILRAETATIASIAVLTYERG